MNLIDTQWTFARDGRDVYFNFELWLGRRLELSFWGLGSPFKLPKVYPRNDRLATSITFHILGLGLYLARKKYQ